MTRLVSQRITLALKVITCSYDVLYYCEYQESVIRNKLRRVGLKDTNLDDIHYKAFLVADKYVVHSELMELGHGSKDSVTQLFKKSPDETCYYVSSSSYCIMVRTSYPHLLIALMVLLTIVFSHFLRKTLEVQGSFLVSCLSLTHQTCQFSGFEDDDRDSVFLTDDEDCEYGSEYGTKFGDIE
ncbi:hypothetical protein Tco_1263052 [Tanacetum coccineum]